MRHTNAGLALAGSLLLMGTGVARADCAAEFADINRVTLTAGPYEIATTISITPPRTMDQSGQVAQSMHVTQILPPRSFRVRTRSAEIIVTGDDKGWVNAGGPWLEMSKEKLADLLEEAPFNGYFVTKDQHDLECQGVQNVDGKSYLTFVYAAVVNVRTKSPQTTQITAYFDPATRLPVGGQTLVEVLGARIQAEMIYKFDPSIRIELPSP